MVKTVAVIGAGASGLCALRHLTAQPNQFQAVGFERYPAPGGTWIYTDRVGRDVDELPVHSSMYQGLRTNLPKDVMMFPDLPFTKQFPSFAKHEEVLQYLQMYAEVYDLAKHIKFQTLVTRVRPLSPGTPDTSWEVTYKGLREHHHTETRTFDSVWICNGHYFSPIQPKIKGQDGFRGDILHAHDLRSVDQYRDRTVVCLGGGPSGLDVVTELAKTAKKVIFSHYGLFGNIPLMENCHHMPPIDHVTDTSAVFTNGEREKVDVILLCTGYQYDFPFLDPACGVTLKDNGRRVTPLYKHLLHTQYPSLFFIGLLHFVIPFTVFDLQVRVAMKVLQGSTTLPSKQEMDEDTQRELDEKMQSGFESRHFHRLMGTASIHCDALCEMAGLEKVPDARTELYNHVIQTVFTSPATYKNINYKMDESTFSVVNNETPSKL